MFTILTIIMTVGIIIGGISALIMVLFGLASVAIFMIKVLMALGLIYLGIKLINDLIKRK